MTSVWTQAEIEAQITALKAELLAVNAAILAIVNGSQSYTLDTGQSRQTVTKANLTELRKLREELRSQLQEWQDMLTGTASYVARPGWG